MIGRERHLCLGQPQPGRTVAYRAALRVDRGAELSSISRPCFGVWRPGFCFRRRARKRRGSRRFLAARVARPGAQVPPGVRHADRNDRTDRNCQEKQAQPRCSFPGALLSRSGRRCSRAHGRRSSSLSSRSSSSSAWVPEAASSSPAACSTGAAAGRMVGESDGVSVAVGQAGGTFAGFVSEDEPVGGDGCGGAHSSLRCASPLASVDASVDGAVRSPGAFAGGVVVTTVGASWRRSLLRSRCCWNSRTSE